MVEAEIGRLFNLTNVKNAFVGLNNSMFLIKSALNYLQTQKTRLSLFNLLMTNPKKHLELLRFKTNQQVLSNKSNVGESIKVSEEIFFDKRGFKHHCL